MIIVFVKILKCISQNRKTYFLVRTISTICFAHSVLLSRTAEGREYSESCFGEKMRYFGIHSFYVQASDTFIYDDIYFMMCAQDI